MVLPKYLSEETGTCLLFFRGVFCKKFPSGMFYSYFLSICKIVLWPLLDLTLCMKERACFPTTGSVVPGTATGTVRETL